ncbi:MAG TPA: Maf family protein [Patescibacteria group bacterium]|nr:Maf family protein [Patescibacteria group bacterium]
MNPFLSHAVQGSLVLASASPRRHEILRSLGFEFEVLPATVDEGELQWDDPERNVRIRAELKAVAAQQHRPRKTIIAADTVVVKGGVELGKPADPREAAEMLAMLSGCVHEVVTGVALISPPNVRFVEVERTSVHFRLLTPREIRLYIETGEPFGKAGAYAIQGLASVFVDRIEGCYFNVVGLPVPRLFGMFRMLEERLGAGS